MIDHQQKQGVWIALFLLGFVSVAFGPAPTLSVSTNGDGDEVTPTPQFFTINGQVINASGGKAPEEMDVVLQAYNGLQVVLEENIEIAEGGSYSFTDIPLVSNWVYLVGVEYKSVSFYSDLLYGDKVYSGREVELPIQIYETSTDTSVLHAERAQVFLGFPDEHTLKVTQSFMISNSSNWVIVPRGEDSTVLEFILPSGAENLSFEQGVLDERFVLTENGFGDRSKVGPGHVEHQVMYSYTVPYDGECMLVLTLPMDVNSFLVELPSNGVRLSNPYLHDIGERDLEGMVMHLYTANELRGGTQLRLQFSGEPHPTGAGSQSELGMTVVGFSAFILALIIVVGWMNQHRPEPVPVEETQDLPSLAEDVLNSAGHTVEMLLESIASLDDLYRTGKLSEDIYKSLRTELKRRLRDAREQKSQPDS